MKAGRGICSVQNSDNNAAFCTGPALLADCRLGLPGNSHSTSAARPHMTAAAMCAGRRTLWPRTLAGYSRPREPPQQARCALAFASLRVSCFADTADAKLPLGVQQLEADASSQVCSSFKCSSYQLSGAPACVLLIVPEIWCRMFASKVALAGRDHIWHQMVLHVHAGTSAAG